MTIDISNALSVKGEVSKYKENPNGLYNFLIDKQQTLSQHLEELDPSEHDLSGKIKSEYDAFDRHIAAMDIQLSGHNQLNIAQLYEAATYLMPELVRREVEAGMYVADRFNYKDLIAAEVPVVGGSFTPYYIPDLNVDSAATRKKNARGTITAGAEMAHLPVRYREKSITLLDYGLVVDVDYKSIRSMAWQQFAVLLRLVGAQISAQKLTDLHLLGTAGDGTVGASSNIFGGTNDTLAYADWVEAYSVFTPPYTLNAILADVDTFGTTLALSQFSDPVNPLNTQFSHYGGKVVTPFGAVMKLVQSTSKTTITAKQAVVFDKNYAVIEGVGQGLLVETDKIIEKKIEQAAISDESCFAILADGAIKQVEWAS